MPTPQEDPGNCRFAPSLTNPAGSPTQFPPLLFSMMVFERLIAAAGPVGACTSPGPSVPRMVQFTNPTLLPRNAPPTPLFSTNSEFTNPCFLPLVANKAKIASFDGAFAETAAPDGAAFLINAARNRLTSAPSLEIAPPRSAAAFPAKVTA